MQWREIMSSFHYYADESTLVKSAAPRAGTGRACVPEISLQKIYIRDKANLELALSLGYF